MYEASRTSTRLLVGIVSSQQQSADSGFVGARTTAWQVRTVLI